MSSRMGPLWFRHGWHNDRPPLAAQTAAGESEVTTALFADICQTADCIHPSHVAKPTSTADVALKRFALGCARDEPVDALVDFVIALEALLLPYDPATRSADLSYRFRVHGACYMADAIEQRPEVFTELRDLYDVRSRLVHGGKPVKQEVVRQTLGLAYRLAAKGLLRATREGFPAADDFKRLVLE